MGISLVFNVADLIKDKGTVSDEVQNSQEIFKDISNVPLPNQEKPHADQILESRV